MQKYSPVRDIIVAEMICRIPAPAPVAQSALVLPIL
jgi:hypothetical protein